MIDRVRVLAHDSAAPRISRRAFLGGLTLVGASVVLPGCGRSKEFAASAAPDGSSESQLNVYSWGDYDDPANIAEFQERGVTVQLDSFASNEEMIAKLGAARGTSGYDVVVPTGNFVPMMSENGLLQELDHTLIPNLSNVERIYRTQSWDPTSTWAICKDWGTTGFAYDTTRLQQRPTSWQEFLDLAQNEASGSTAMLEDPWEVTSTYFFANGIDPNTDDPAALDACETFLVDKIAPHLRAFASNASNYMIQNDFALVQVWNGDARLGKSESDDPERWTFVFPDEGANLWMDTWAIAAGTQHPDSAHEFIDFMLTPEVGIREVDYIGYPTGLVGQVELARRMELDMSDLIFPDLQVLRRLVAAEITESQERLVQIYGRMQARAGA
jgi:spermidine/putrescine transport system substrate-binding protein